MLRPVRAVGACPPKINCAIYIARCYNRLVWPLWLRIAAGWEVLPRVDAAAPDRLRPLDLAGPDRFPPAAFQLPDRYEPTHRWQPWPVEPAWTDRVDLRWPSSDWPPAPRDVVIEDNSPDAPPQVILWRDTGGLLDMWA